MKTGVQQVHFTRKMVTKYLRNVCRNVLVTLAGYNTIKKADLHHITARHACDSFEKIKPGGNANDEKSLTWIGIVLGGLVGLLALVAIGLVIYGQVSF